MNNNDIFKYVDHTKLSATATSDEILTLCGEAVKYGTASVCIRASGSRSPDMRNRAPR